MIEYITANWEQIGFVVVAAIMFFERLAKLTPTETDNKIVAQLQKIFSVLGLHFEDNKGNVKDSE